MVLNPQIGIVLISVFLFFTPPSFAYTPGDYERKMGGENKINELWSSFKRDIPKFELYTTRYADYSEPILLAMAQIILEFEDLFEGKTPDHKLSERLARGLLKEIKRLGVSETLIPQWLQLMELALEQKRYDLLATLSPVLFFLNPVLTNDLEEKMKLPKNYELLTTDKEFFERRFGFHTESEANSARESLSKTSPINLKLNCVEAMGVFKCAQGFSENQTLELYDRKVQILTDTITTLYKNPVFGASPLVSETQFKEALKKQRPNYPAAVASVENILELATPGGSEDQIRKMEAELSKLELAGRQGIPERMEIPDIQIEFLFDFLTAQLESKKAALLTSKLSAAGGERYLGNLLKEVENLFLRNNELRKLGDYSKILEKSSVSDAFEGLKYAMAIFQKEGLTEDGIPVIIAEFASILINELSYNAVYGGQIPEELKGFLKKSEGKWTEAEVQQFATSVGEHLINALAIATSFIPVAGPAVCTTIKVAGPGLLEKCSPLIAKSVMKRWDMDKDGRIDGQEVRAAMRAHFEETKGKIQQKVETAKKGRQHRRSKPSEKENKDEKDKLFPKKN